jgi:hypothetical protein
MLASNRGAITPDISTPTPADDESLGYHERKERQICTYPGCPDDAGETGECDRHTARSRRRKRRWKRQQLARQKTLLKIWARKRRCLRCGAKRVSGHEHCTKCLVAIGTAPIVSGDKQVDKQQRIAAATTIDADGRNRYRGQAKRGRQSVAQLDDQDLRFALEALQKARDGIAWLSTVADGAMSKNEKQDAIGAALAHAIHSSRLVDDVLERHGYFKPIAPERKAIKR